MKKHFCILCTGLLLAGSLTGCTGPASPAPTTTPVATATPSPSPSPTPAPTATPVPTPRALSEDEEKTEFLAFWEDSGFAYRINDPDWTESVEESRAYYFVVSLYLEHHAERLGETILYDTDGAPCFPYEDFLGTAQAIFGPDTDYTAYIPNEPGPEGTARAAWGYGGTYVQAELDENSFVLDDDTITVQALRRWMEPGYTEDLGTLTYTFAVQPENEYCRYRLLSVEEVS